MTGTSLVLKVYAWPKLVLEEPEAPEREVQGLAWAGQAGLLAPEVVAADVTGQVVDVPAVLMERVPGRAQASPPITKLAALSE